MRSKWLFVLISLALSVSALAESKFSAELTTTNFVAQIQAHTPSELNSILKRVEILLEKETEYPSSSPVALVLHGDEVSVFLRENYADHRDIVDLAARLDAFNMIDIQVCETWMRLNNVNASQLPAFVNSVPYGPASEQDLLDDGYEYF